MTHRSFNLSELEVTAILKLITICEEQQHIPAEHAVVVNTVKQTLNSEPTLDRIIDMMSNHVDYPVCDI